MLYKYLKKIILNFICCFIPSRELRHKIRSHNTAPESIRRKIQRIESNIDIIAKALTDKGGLGYLNLMMKNAKIPEKYYYIIQSIQPNDICIDCGANVGVVSDIFRFQGAIVYAFEPNANLFNSVLKRKYLGDDKVHLYQQAVSNMDGDIKFHHDYDERFNLSYSEGGTLFERSDSEGKSTNTGQCDIVKAINFGNFLKNEFKNKQIYLIKIDIEGAEFEVVEQIIKENLHKNVKYILVETHERFFNDGEQKLQRLKDLIKDNNIDNVYLDWI